MRIHCDFLISPSTICFLGNYATYILPPHVTVASTNYPAPTTLFKQLLDPYITSTLELPPSRRDGEEAEGQGGKATGGDDARKSSATSRLGKSDRSRQIGRSGRG